MAEGVYLNRQWLLGLAQRLRVAPDLNDPRRVAQELELAVHLPAPVRPLTDWAKNMDRAARLRIASKLADMAELEQVRALGTERSAEDRISSQQQAILLGERDRHIARAGAFLEAIAILTGEQ